jgi:AraC family transcriptional regulator
MSLTNKALFVIERNLSDAISLSWVADQCNSSQFHLVRAFGEATGFSLMEYVRSRRLTNAAHELAKGTGDILSIALDQQYASHEAFSRAFKARFGKSPDEVRKARSTHGLPLVEAIRQKEGKGVPLKEPTVKSVGELKFVGLSRNVPYDQMQTIAGQWQHFMSNCYRNVDNKLPEPPVGVTTASTHDGLDYLCAAEVSSFGEVPKGCTKLTLAPGAYAVFAHDGHITDLRQTYDAIWNEWFPKSGKSPAETSGLERHNASFDPRTGNGGVTIWIPIMS